MKPRRHNRRQPKRGRAHGNNAIQLTLLAIGLCFGYPASAQDASTLPPREFLFRTFAVSERDLAGVDQGQILIRLVPDPDPRAISAIGLVRVSGRAESLVTLAHDVARLRKSTAGTQVGRFAGPAVTEDLAHLVLPPNDIEALMQCRPGNCDVKLDAAAIRRMQAEVNWKASDRGERATALLREILLDRLRAYQAQGTAALGTSQDKKQSQDLVAGYRQLLERSRFLATYTPRFFAYLQEYPEIDLTGIEEMFFWSQDPFGPKPVLTISHLVFSRQPQGDCECSIIATKQIYASHYFQAGLDIMILIDAEADAKRPGGFYLVNVFRSLIDPPTGLLAGKVRGRIESSLKKALNDKLADLRQQVESGD